MSYLKKTVFAALFVVLVFVCLELVLRLGGFVYLRASGPDGSGAQPGSIPVVMCLGDSFTFGLGAGADESYPAVLSRLLKNRARVVNRGRLGANTHVIVKELPGLIDKDNPDIIVLLAGLNNGWNSQGLCSFVSGRGAKSAAVADWFLGLRTVKLFKIVLERFKTLKNGAKTETAQNSKKILALETEQELLDEIGQNPVSPLAYRMLARLYFGRGEPSRAINFLKQSITRNPQVPELYEYLADIYLELGQETEAVEAVFNGIEKYPRNRRFYDTCLGIFKHIRDPRALGLIKERFRKMAEYFELGREFYALFSSDLASEGIENLTWRWVLSDIGEIAGLCRDHGVRLVLLNYPCPGEHENALRGFAAERGIVFVDQFMAFAREATQEGLFVPDGHCSARGYELMARNVKDVLNGEGLLADD